VIINQIHIHRILLPFSNNFSHSRKEGRTAKNVIVEIIAEQGQIKGYGEGAPRPYVTGETQESVTKAIIDFLQVDSFPWHLNDVSQIWNFVGGLPVGKAYHSAICALEASLLDALAKSQGKSVIEYFPQDFYSAKICYGAGIPLCNRARMIEMCHTIKRMKINKIKLKMGKEFKRNKEIIQTARQIFGVNDDLKIDVNGAWNNELALEHVGLIRDNKISVVEQPMMPGDLSIAHFAKIMQDAGVLLMADESACSLADMERIVEEGHYKMVNVRLSKCGGFENSFKIIDYLRKAGVFFQIAAHLGESGILSAAGRVLSVLCSDAVYYDGSYDEFLLRENVTLENVSFGLGGEAGPLKGPGLGVEINHESLQRLSNPSTMVTIGKP
jgi:L-alanine-DL-glutamate epimerase-like enolase superfamily enzyme